MCSLTSPVECVVVVQRMLMWWTTSRVDIFGSWSAKASKIVFWSPLIWRIEKPRSNRTDRLRIIFFDQAFCSISSLFNKARYGMKYITLIEVPFLYHAGDNTCGFQLSELVCCVWQTDLRGKYGWNHPDNLADDSHFISVCKTPRNEFRIVGYG